MGNADDVRTGGSGVVVSKKFPVAEIFGPTIQGEGIDQGIPCHFIRLGGCDFSCEWCDTPHAVLAQNVRALPRMDEDEIVASVKALPGFPSWVVVSGGNPALHDLAGLVARLQGEHYQVAVETQGTRYKHWLSVVDRLCVSPKPPSSGMKYTMDDLLSFLSHLTFSRLLSGKIFIKVVVFDQADYEYAKQVFRTVRRFAGANFEVPLYVSAGNDAGATVGNPSRRDERTVEQVRNDLLDKARWLTNWVMVDPEMADVQVQAQYHVALWGNELGR